MTLYESIKKATPDQMAALLLLFIKAFLGTDDKDKLRECYEIIREGLNQEVGK